MNLGLLRALQSMAEIEKNPYFRPKKYVIVDKEDLRADPSSDAIPVVLKHPDNVIVVASPTGNAPPPAVGERRVSQLSEAIEMAMVMASIGKQGCSIVVHAGLYIDPSCAMVRMPNWSEDFSVEIVGLEEVRVLNTSTTMGLKIFGFGRMSFALRNLIIYGLREPSQHAIFVSDCRMSLKDIKIHGATGFPLLCSHSSELEASDCVFSEVKASFGTIILGSSAKFSNCRWQNEVGDKYGGFSPGNKRDIKAEGLNCAVSVLKEANAKFRHCQFISEIGVDMQTHTALDVMREGRVSVTSCQLSGFKLGADVSGSGSRAVFKSCVILECDSAVLCQVNSVAMLRYNEKGKVLFQENTVESTRFPSAFPFSQPPPSGTAVVLTDREPKVLEHDFLRVQIECFRKPKDYQRLTTSRGATRKSREDYAEFYSKMTKDF